MTRAERNALAQQPLSLAHRVPGAGRLNTVGTNPARRVATVVQPTGAGVRRSRRDPATKGQNEWRTTSQNYHTHATIDRRWSATASTPA